MGRHNTVESLSRLFQVIKIISRDGGATITQISNETGIDRWTVKDMIDSIDNLGNDGKGLCITEEKNPRDRRETLYSINKDNLWSLTLPKLNLTDEERMLLALLLQQSKQVPLLKDAADGLKNKINWLKDSNEYQIYNINDTERIVDPESKKALSIICSAIREDRCLEFDYNNKVNTKSGVRRVMPLYLFAYDAGLYLNAQKTENGELRTYAIERIQGLPRIIDIKESDKPKKAEYDGRLEDPISPFPDHEEFELEVTFNSWQGWYNLQRRWPSSVKITKNNNDTITMRIKTRSGYGAQKWILSQWKDVLSIKPEWIKDEIVRTVNKMLSAIDKKTE